MLTSRTRDDGTQEVKCRCTLQGFKDPDVPDLVRDRKTEGPTLSANDRALILQLVASCRFVLTIGDVQAACLLADREERPIGPHHVTMLNSCVKEGMHPDQLFEGRGGDGLGDQPQPERQFPSGNVFLAQVSSQAPGWNSGPIFPYCNLRRD